MKRMVLIPCVSMKLPHSAKAKDLYVSPLFRLILDYSRKLEPDSIYVLSAKHHLLDLDTEVGPYNLTLNAMPVQAVRAWADEVINQLTTHADLGRDHFVLLVGERYRRFLLPRLASYEIPMLGMPIGKQLQFLSRSIHE